MGFRKCRLKWRRVSELAILIIDDSADDAALFERALRKAGFGGRVDKALSAEAAITHLVLCSGKAHRNLPDLIVLDYKLKWMGGAQFLEWLSVQPVFGLVPVIVLSGAASSVEVSRAYALGAKTVFVKPVAPHELTQLAGRMVAYWEIAIRPGADTTAAVRTSQGCGVAERDGLAD